MSNKHKNCLQLVIAHDDNASFEYAFAVQTNERKAFETVYKAIKASNPSLTESQVFTEASHALVDVNEQMSSLMRDSFTNAEMASFIADLVFAALTDSDIERAAMDTLDVLAAKIAQRCPWLVTNSQLEANNKEDKQ